MYKKVSSLVEKYDENVMACNFALYALTLSLDTTSLFWVCCLLPKIVMIKLHEIILKYHMYVISKKY